MQGFADADSVAGLHLTARRPCARDQPVAMTRLKRDSRAATPQVRDAVQVFVVMFRSLIVICRAMYTRMLLCEIYEMRFSMHPYQVSVF